MKIARVCRREVDEKLVPNDLMVTMKEIRIWI